MKFTKIYNYLATILTALLFFSCSYGIDGPFDNSTILSSVDFFKKRERYDPVFADTMPIAKSLEKPILIGADSDEVIVIPVPERGAIVQSRRAEKIRLETAGLCACVGIVGWNSKNIGCVHWDLGGNKHELKRFADDLTSNKELLGETAFLLVTNFLSEHLEGVHKFLREYAPVCQIFLEAEFYHGGHVISENHKWFHNLQNQDEHFDLLSRKRKPSKLKSVSIKSHFSEGECPYTFNATKPAKHVQEYFVFLDALAARVNTADYMYQDHPHDFWGKRYPLKIDEEPKMLWIIAGKLYNDFKARCTSGNPQKLMYLYDSKESLPKID